jgi:hypothetical protein
MLSMLFDKLLIVQNKLLAVFCNPFYAWAFRCIQFLDLFLLPKIAHEELDQLILSTFPIKVS